MTYPKRLIEVDLPIKRISTHARREKNLRHGHIATLHIWWARRPLAACRAVICAALWPDPADPLCPDAFRRAAESEIRIFAVEAAGNAKISEICDRESWQRYSAVARKNHPISLESLRGLLLDFIADFAAWEASISSPFLRTARNLTQAAHVALGGIPGTRPLVLDPFAGGGAIPLEALRVGADAFASDLNPVAVILNKVVLEYIPQFGKRLSDEILKWGHWVRDEAEQELAEYYPKDRNGSAPIAFLWARTIMCEGPACGADVPLLRSLWLAKKGKNSTALRLVPRPHDRQIDFEIIQDAKTSDVKPGTVARGAATCPICGYTTPVKSVRIQLSARKGGAEDARLIAVRQDNPESGRRSFRLPTEQDHRAIQKAKSELKRRIKEHRGDLPLVPDEPTPKGGGSGAGRAFSQRNYGMNLFGDLFSPRQLLALTTIVGIIRRAGELMKLDSTDSGLARATTICLSLALDRLADFNSSLCVLNVTGGRGVVHTFGRQALPIVWDFMETNPLNEVGANWIAGVHAFAETIETEAASDHAGHAVLSSAFSVPMPDGSAHALVTDPPYYDSVPYADLSDFFYVWLRRTLRTFELEGFDKVLTPKEDECIVDEVKGKDNQYFEKSMKRAMIEGRRLLSDGGIGLVVFAHKSTAGWEAQLQAMIDAGWIVTGSWPIDTERQGRLRAQESAALASSIHLVCRPRAEGAGEEVGEWREVLTLLPKRIHEWMPRLAKEGVVGADAIFACLGPALEVFSRYSRVEKASGEEVRLGDFMEYVWASVSQEALQMVFEGADASGFEEDARLTAMWLWTLSAGNGHKSVGTQDDESEDTDEEDGSGKEKASGYALEYDTARKIAQGLGAYLENLQSVVVVEGETARLLPVTERTAHLFGKAQGDAPVSGRKKSRQWKLAFEEELEQAESTEGWGDKGAPKVGVTVLDRVHQSMILFAAGRGEALRRFLDEEGVGREGRFWTLAQALSALYPAGSDEKRWIDGVLARKRGSGF